MRIFKNQSFARFARKAGITDFSLRLAMENANRGLIDADLGGGVIKQRIARPGSGKSGGFRTIILFQAGTRGFFIHGFAKNERDNINSNELANFRKLAAEMLAYDDHQIAHALEHNILIEVANHD